MYLNVLVQRRRQSITMCMQPLGRKTGGKEAHIDRRWVAKRYKAEEEIAGVKCRNGRR